MYLKRKKLKEGIHYILSESYREGKCWKHRHLVDLGTNPSDFIEYPGGNSFYIREDLPDALNRKGIKYSSNDLETLFLPFLDPRIRRIIETFENRKRKKGRWNDLSEEELFKKQKDLHPFDKRRLHYLRCGRVNIGNLEDRPWKFLNILLDKSRDEIETIMETMEQDLPPSEIRQYLYTALQLQNYFRYNLTRHTPAALDPDKVDHYFAEDLCRLNSDEIFFRGLDHDYSDTLHPYLVRYLIMYFDNDFDRGTIWNDYFQDFIRRRQFYRPPSQGKSTSMTEWEACNSLGISTVEFKQMNRQELTTRYRRLAKETHPDKGGTKKRFIEVKEAYEYLVIKKPARF